MAAIVNDLECHRRSFPFQMQFFIFVACRDVLLHLQSFLSGLLLKALCLFISETSGLLELSVEYI